MHACHHSLAYAVPSVWYAYHPLLSAELNLEIRPVTLSQAPPSLLGKVSVPVSTMLGSQAQTAQGPSANMCE